MPTQYPAPGGLWLPLITPFRDGALDELSLRRLARHYAAEPLDGLILAATTGEGLTLDDAETERLVAVVAEELAAANRRLPLFLGLSGSDTRKLVKALAHTAPWVSMGWKKASSPVSTAKPGGLRRSRSKDCAMSAEQSFTPTMFGSAASSSIAAFPRFTPVRYGML